MPPSPRIILGSSRPRVRSFMAQPFKHPDSGMYYLRRRVPDELISSLGREYKRSLKTRDPGEAKARFATEWQKSEEAFSLAKAQLSGIDILSARDVQQLAARWFNAELNELERTGMFRSALVPLDGATTIETADSYEEYRPYGSIRDAIEEGDETNWLAVVKPYVLQSLKAENIPTPSEDSPAYR